MESVLQEADFFPVNSSLQLSVVQLNTALSQYSASASAHGSGGLALNGGNLTSGCGLALFVTFGLGRGLDGSLLLLVGGWDDIG